MGEDEATIEATIIEIDNLYRTPDLDSIYRLEEEDDEASD